MCVCLCFRCMCYSVPLFSVILSVPVHSGVTRSAGRGRRTAPGDTLQGLTPERKKLATEFTNNSGQTRSDK